MKEFVNIGFIQTVVEGQVAWPVIPPYKMLAESEEKVWAEIKKGFVELLSGYEKPHIILIPELSVPHSYERELRSLSASSGAIVIAGLDFTYTSGKVVNRAAVIIPRNWPSSQRSVSTSFFYFGKTFYSDEEVRLIGSENLISHPDIYILNSETFGVFGLAICSDFFDVERFVVYKGRIHHLIIIAHNRDTESYYFLAEAIGRLVYCNVVICNTGEFGDSLAFSPLKDHFRRMLYRHKGQGLFSTQVVSLPVRSLDEEQQSNVRNVQFKGRPPGYEKKNFS